MPHPNRGGPLAAWRRKCLFEQRRGAHALRAPPLFVAFAACRACFSRGLRGRAALWSVVFRSVRSFRSFLVCFAVCAVVPLFGRLPFALCARSALFSFVLRSARSRRSLVGCLAVCVITLLPNLCVRAPAQKSCAGARACFCFSLRCARRKRKKPSDRKVRRLFCLSKVMRSLFPKQLLSPWKG